MQSSRALRGQLMLPSTLLPELAGDARVNRASGFVVWYRRSGHIPWVREVSQLSGSRLLG
eukprot:1974027-Alexandrium_andersonii.AAC.1